MNKINRSIPALCSLFLFLLLALSSQAQTKYTSGGNAKIVINGTSNIHDWILQSSKGNCTGTMQVDGAGNLTGIQGLNFTMAVQTLKSEHGSQMDNNAYKAMTADKTPNISFSSESATVTAKGGGTYTISAPGKLQISSGTKQVTLLANAKMNADKSLTIDGAYKLVTTDYNVKPISIMLGAIKTSANVTINYSLVMRPQ